MIICVTNRKLCRGNFLKRINQIAKGRPHRIILREKDLSISEYEYLAITVKNICDTNQVRFIISEKLETAKKIGIRNIHLSMPALRIYKNEIHHFAHISASVHSVLEAKEAEELGADCLIAGHIFATDCKKGVPPRGLSFLKEVCDSSAIPVFAIGGITKDNSDQVMSTGAQGICVMSEAMTCLNPTKLIRSFCERRKFL